MRFIFIPFILCSLMACAVQPKKIYSIKKETIEIPYGHTSESPTIDVYLMGKGPFKFEFDTAATQSSISPALARELGVMPDKSVPKSSVLLIDKIVHSYFSEMTDIYLGKDKILLRSRLKIRPSNGSGGRIGTIGLATLFDAKIVNNPDKAQLTITLDANDNECDPLKIKSKCNYTHDVIPTIDIKLGREKFTLFLDTGFDGTTPFILFKSNATNRIWSKYHNVFKTEKNAAVSDLPFGRIFTKDFVFNGTKGCFADFYIKHPKDKSPRIVENIGTLGWWVIKEVAFEYDLKTQQLYYPQGACPNKKINMIGIGAAGRSADDESRVFIFNIINGSPADLAGIVNYDVLKRVTLADGTMLEPLTKEYVARKDDIYYAPEGTVVKFDVERDGNIIKIPIISKGPKFLSLDGLK